MTDSVSQGDARATPLRTPEPSLQKPIVFRMIGMRAMTAQTANDPIVTTAQRSSATGRFCFTTLKLNDRVIQPKRSKSR